MSVARELQGLELPLCDVLDVYEALAGAEASVAWIVWNNALPCLLGRFLERATRAEIFADPAWWYALSTRPSGRATVDGDAYRVSGRWALVSGCELAEWIALLCVVEENGQPRMLGPGQPETRFAFLRRADCQILDTWYVGGLRGTGSHDVVVDAVRVPRRCMASPADGVSLDAPIGRMPIIPSMAAGYGAQLLGIGRTALETVVALTATKVNVDPGRPGMGERGDVLAAIPRHSTALDAARTHLHACASRLWERAGAGRPASLEEITAMWGAAHHAAAAGRNAVDAMYAAGGTSSIYEDCPLERAYRDVHAMDRHIVAQPIWLEDAGRVRLGLAPLHPLFAL
jgi:alkylation response protein AidB-like acyl-CoA dehydrogenase